VGSSIGGRLLAAIFLRGADRDGEAEV
jgi:hypothetical protein